MDEAAQILTIIALSMFCLAGALFVMMFAPWDWPWEK